jgi:LacI family transcriptional regulator
MRDVAAVARVSAKTVSRVFNGDPHVSLATRTRVEAALRELNYVPSSLATNFRAGRAPVIGVAIPDLVDPFFAALADAIGDLAMANRMSIVVTSLGQDPAYERQGDRRGATPPVNQRPDHRAKRHRPRLSPDVE